MVATRNQLSPLEKLPPELTNMILKELGSRYDSLGDLVCLGLTSKTMASQVLGSKVYAVLDDCTKQQLWRENFGPCLDHFTYPTMAMLPQIEQCRREWLGEGEGERLGAWVMQDVARWDRRNRALFFKDWEYWMLALIPVVVLVSIFVSVY